MFSTDQGCDKKGWERVVVLLISWDTGGLIPSSWGVFGVEHREESLESATGGVFGREVREDVRGKEVREGVAVSGGLWLGKRILSVVMSVALAWAS